MTGTVVAVDADALEQLVRGYHVWLEHDECRCGWTGYEGDHGSHVAHMVREALAGRL